MDEKLTKDQVLDTLNTERSRWEAVLAEVGEARMIAPIRGGWWSVKDTAAHVAWQPWKLIADHSYRHYQQHTASIRAWLDTGGMGWAKR